MSTLGIGLAPLHLFMVFVGFSLGSGLHLCIFSCFDSKFFANKKIYYQNMKRCKGASLTPGKTPKNHEKM